MTETKPTDLDIVLQQVLDLAELQQYFHPTLEGRVPVNIARSDAFTGEPGLIKFDQPVRYVDKEQFVEDEYAAYIEFRAVELSEQEATVYFAYEVEGVGGEVSLEKDNASGQWRVKDASVYEQ